MTTTIGNLNFKVSATSVGVAETMDRTAASVNAVTKSTQRANAAMAQAGSGGGSSKFARGFLELSRGVEDFAAVAPTMGVAGGLRAASNNISQFASVMSPAAGAVAGLAVALGTVLIPKLFDTEKAAKKVADAVKLQEASFAGVQRSIESLQSLREFSRDAGRIFDPKQVGNDSQRVIDQIKDVEAKMSDIGMKRAAIEKSMVVATGEKRLGGFGWGDKGISSKDESLNKVRTEQIGKLTEMMQIERERKAVLDKQLGVLNQQAKAASEQALALERISLQDEAVKRVHDEMVERNRLRGVVESINRSNLDAIDKEGAKRREIMRDYASQVDAINKSPFDATEKSEMKKRAMEARDKRLGETNLDKLNENKSLLQMQLDRLQRERSVTPVQQAMERGSASAVSFINRTQNKPEKTQAEQQIIAEIKKSNSLLAKITGKPIQLIQGYWN